MGPHGVDVGRMRNYLFSRKMDDSAKEKVQLLPAGVPADGCAHASSARFNAVGQFYWPPNLFEGIWIL